ncbi:MAG: translocation/assembly module TamB [Acidobacteriia bacterium]|nr:translocation/assembly module TamB [Terriglobia bacterium]
MTRRRLAWIAAILAGGILAAAVAAVLVLRSAWFYGKVRERLVSVVETATGGRVEIGSFQFDWRKLRAEVKGFTLHGTEPSDRPPLLHAASAAAGLKIVSLFKRDVDIHDLEVIDPRIYLIVYPDGGTNVPKPRIRKHSDTTTVEDILDMKIGRFHLQNGIFEVEARIATPFDARGQNLNARLQYDRAGPRYRGNISIQPLVVAWPDLAVTPFGVALAVTAERNRIELNALKLTTGDSVIEASGALEDLRTPHGSFPYHVRVAVRDLDRVLETKLLERGTIQVGGTATWTDGAGLSATGNLHAYNIDFNGAYVALRDFRAEGAVAAGANGIEVTGMRLAGNYRAPASPVPLEGSIRAVSLRGQDLELRGIELGGLGGSFGGDARLADFRRFRVMGDIGGVAARRVVALYSKEALPWDGIATGQVTIEGVLQQKNQLRATANLVVTPAPQSAPVFARITAAYDARSDTLDLGRSTITLPSSHADFSGAINRQIRVHLETRDVNDFLPVLGESAASLPVKLEHGAAVFDGTVTGKVDDPQIAGRLSVTRFSYSGKSFDSLAADVALSSASAALQNASLARGQWRAQFQGSLGLDQWKADGHSSVAGSGTVRNAPVADLLALVDAKIALTGALSGSAQVAGTIGNPTVGADLDVSDGAFREEPFDRFTGHVNVNERTLAVASGQLLAGGKQVSLSATFDHEPKVFDAGRLRFQVNSNAMPLDQVRTLVKERPGVKGTVQVAIRGEVDLASGKGADGLRVLDLHADILGHSLQLTGQPLGDAHLTADSQGQLLRAHLETNVAGSAVRGDGEWRLDGDHQGSANITFSKLDFAQLLAWISPAAPAASPPVSGFAEGAVHITGPALKPKMMKAELRIPQFELSSAPDSAGNRLGGAETLTLRNSGPIVATLANDVVTVESARLVGRSTDMAITGKMSLQDKSPLDVRVKGKVDLAILHDFNRDFVSSGELTGSFAVRGALDAPQVDGRVEFQDAAFSLADFPNGISKASGVIAFTGDRATIQSFTGETGGGQIDLSGFAGYAEGQAIFRVHARVREVRVRYPEGVSTVANGSLNLTGTSDRSMISGTLTILRTGFNPQSDFSSILAKSAQPVRTASARTGFIGGLNFDVQVDTAPDIQFQSALTQDLQVEANLKLRGTFSNPAVLGRINITQGQMVFFGTKYTINQGSVAFYNPVRVDPILDVDLETKARGIDITLNVSGPLTKLNLTPRSDPPLQFQEIVALLATGRTPTSDPTLLTQQSTAPQSWQQMGASALLGQAIASPVAGRLQRFFGVSQLRIDPTLPGVENNPQARLTLEQQVTPDITFTYITNVTTSNPQVVRMEWAFAKQWSVVALREENGLFGIDFFFKKRF